MSNLQQNKKNKGAIFVSSKLLFNKIVSRIVVSDDLKGFFNSFDFFVSYDEDIVENFSLLNIPVLSRVLPLAWVFGADVYVDELDETYVKSMGVLQQEYKKTYPKPPFRTRLIAKQLIKNESVSKKSALLFSGGVDSFYSLFKNIHLNPRLITVIGVAGIPIENVFFPNVLEKEFTNFAEREHLKINFIRTNIMEVFNRRRVNQLWNRHKGIHEGDFWDGIGYSLGQIGLSAPFSTGRFNNIIISAGGKTKGRVPGASYQYTNEKIRWGNLKVIHYGGIHRHEKVFLLRNFMRDHKIKFRVCFSTSKDQVKNNVLNCSRCEKCLRTIISLVLARINPNKHGFLIDESTFESIKYLLENKVLTRDLIEIFWSPLQQLVPEKMGGDFYGSKQFFEWFKHFNLDLAAKKQDKISYIYNQLPNSIKYFLEVSKIYDLFGHTRGLLQCQKLSLHKPIETSPNE